MEEETEEEMEDETREGIRRILEHYRDLAPDRIEIEGRGGSHYPKDIGEPDIPFITLPEPHTLITDWDENPQDWYDIPELIHELSYQSYAAYYRGLYLASLVCSMNCLELVIKYESLLHGENPERLEDPRYTFGQAIDGLGNGLKEYEERLRLLNSARNGMFHFNPAKIKKAAREITPEDADAIPTDNVFELSLFAHFSYEVMHSITSYLYGEHRRKEFIEKGWEDYRKKKIEKGLRPDNSGIGDTITRNEDPKLFKEK